MYIGNHALAEASNLLGYKEYAQQDFTDYILTLEQ